jgi:hypothetical protein
MFLRVLPGLAVICFAVTSSVAEAAPKRAPVASAMRAPLQVHTGRQAGATQPFKPLQLQVSPHKADASPGPAPRPEFNPLKRRRLAMPVTPDSDFAF